MFLSVDTSVFKASMVLMLLYLFAIRFYIPVMSEMPLIFCMFDHSNSTLIVHKYFVVVLLKPR